MIHPVHASVVDNFIAHKIVIIEEVYSAPHEETENHTFEVFVISLSRGTC